MRVEQFLPGQHRVGHAGQRVNVDAWIELLAGQLFRRHVRRGSDEGQLVRHGSIVEADQRLGQAEIHQLDHAVVGQHHVAGLDVAVQQVLPVHVGQCSRKLADDGPHELLVDGATRSDEIVQARAVDELHDQEVGSVGRESSVQSRDVLLSKSFDDLGFLFEARQRGRVVDQAVAHHLQGDSSTPFEFARFVHDGHASATHALEDAVTVQHLAAEDIPVRATQAVGDQVRQNDAQHRVLVGQAMEFLSLEGQCPHILPREDVGPPLLTRDQSHLADDVPGTDFADAPHRVILVARKNVRRPFEQHEQAIARVPLPHERVARDEGPLFHALPHGAEQVAGEFGECLDPVQDRPRLW